MLLYAMVLHIQMRIHAFSARWFFLLLAIIMPVRKNF